MAETETGTESRRVEIEIGKVDEAAAQRLADATGKVTYLRNAKRIWIWPKEEAEVTSACITTDREEAVAWGESVAFVPRPRREPPRSWPEWGELAREASAKVLGEQQKDQKATESAAPWLTPGVQHVQCDRCHTVHDAGKCPIAYVEAELAKRGAAEPEPQLRVVRVLEYRGPQIWVEKTLANSFITPLKPYTTNSGVRGSLGEITEQLRTRERLCRHCGGEHLGVCSEDECSANEWKGRY